MDKKTLDTSIVQRVFFPNNIEMVIYLLVDGRDERCFDAHAQRHTDMMELMEEERVDDGSHEEH